MKFNVEHIPSTLTLIGMSLGVTAILLAFTTESLLLPTILILAATITDFLDGFTARTLDAASDFGKELDSLSDLLCFGLAPTVLLHLHSNELLHFATLVIGLFYTLCTAIRLAHFNSVEFDDEFSGLPSPASAILVLASCQISPFLGVLAACFGGLLMVSPIPHPSPKSIVTEKPLWLIVGLAAAIGSLYAGLFWLSLLAAILCYIGIAIKYYLDEQ